MAKRTREPLGYSDIVGDPTTERPKVRLRLGGGTDVANEGQPAEEGKPAEENPEKPTPEPLNATEEQCCVDVAAILLEDAEKDLERRHKAGVRLLQEYPAGIQARGREVIKQAALRCGLNPSDLYRMRTFAKTYPSFEDLTKKHPEVKTWSKVKEVLAQENQEAKQASADTKDQAAAAKKAAAKEQQARERAKKEFIQLLAVLRKMIKKVPLTRLMLEEAQDIEEAFEEIATALTPLVGPMKAMKSAIKKEKVSTEKAAQ